MRTMKTRDRLLAAAALCAVLCIAALGGCDNGFEPQDTKPAALKGTVRVVIADGQPARDASRTVVPDNPGFAYTLTFTTNGKDAVLADLTGNMGEVLLDAGTWTLVVTGQKQGATVAESDAVSVTLEGEPVSMTVTVHPALNGAEGTFRYRIGVNGAITDVSAVLTPLDVGSADQGETSLAIGDEQIINVAPGYYRLMVRAVKGNQTLVRREVVHIYSYTETVKIYDLTEADFAPAVYLAGTLVGGIAGYSPTAVLAYEDAECQTDSGSGAVQGDAWSLEAEGTPETVYFKVKLTKDGADAYYSKPVAVSGVPARGKTDIEIPIEGYTVTFDANGGTFEGGGDTVTVAAPENGTLTPPVAAHSEYAFEGWYSTSGGGFTAETPVPGDLTVYAGWEINAEDIQDELEHAAGGDTAVDPVPLTLSIPLVKGGSWKTILSAISASGKYVALDLSACAMTGTEFDPGTGTAGADKVVSLVLPDAATGIPAGEYDNATFKDFTSLASLSGAGIETVGNDAFRSCRSLESVSLPAATSIGDWAFSGCDALTTVSLPVATDIGERAFSSCRNLESVSLPVATTIGGSAFSGCTNLASVSLPVATTIGGSAFSGCTSLASVSLPAATSIGGSAFSDCTSLASVSLPVATTIGGSAFIACTSLASVSLPVATDIGDSAFSGCTSLASVSLPVATDIGGSAFYYCTSLASVSLPVATDIGGSAFSGCTSLASVSLPAATSIGGSAFSGCTSLASVSLPVATDIGERVFYGCTSLASVSLPVATSIGGYAFSDCTSLTSVSLPAATSIGGSAFSDCTSLASVSLPVAITIGGYAFYRCDALTSVSLPVATDIGGSAFAYCTSLASVSLPVAITIGGSAFSSCTSLASVSLPVATDIGGSAFAYCTSLASVSLPAATTIGGWAFRGCDALTSVSLPAAATIGESAFYACTNLTTITIDPTNTVFSAHDGMLLNKAGTTLLAYPSASGDITLPVITSIGNEAFNGCTNLESVSLPAATFIGNEAFNGCTSLESVSLPAARIIGGSAFAYCTSLESVSLPAAASISGDAFFGCTSLESVSLPAATYIREYAFHDCNALTSVSLPAAIYIREYAFHDCNALTSVSLPAAASIGGSAFSSCTSLAEVSLPAATFIGSYAFSGCTSLAEVSLPAAPPSIYGIFYGTGDSGTITVSVPTGAVSAYTSAWGVDASTAANGNTGVYGENHKAVLITD